MQKENYLKAVETLNNQQKEAFDLMVQFIADQDKNYFVLKGYAGTGKTYLVGKLIDYVTQEHKELNISITAPTHKAVGVVKEHFKNISKKIKRKLSFNTIHALLGLKPVINDKTGEETFVPDKFMGSGSVRGLLLIDETSMLSDELFFLLDEQVENSKEPDLFTKKITPLKIIFIGDPKQIPPVGKQDSEPFLNPDKYEMETYELTQIMRQADGNAIIEASYHVRENIHVDALELAQFANNKHLVHFNSLLINERKIIAATLKSCFDFENYSKEMGGIRVIAWRNVKIAEYNAYLRRIYHANKFPNGDIPEYVAGDILVANRPHEDGRTILFQNSTELTVKSAEKCVKQVVDKYFEAKKQGDYVPTLVESWAICAEYFDADKNDMVPVEFYVVSEAGKSAYNKVLDTIKGRALNTTGQMRGMTWDNWYQVRNQFADVTYGFALTAHKSQGSTYSMTFIDLNDICLNSNVIERNRIIYTAITRAKNKVFLIGK